MTAIIAENVSKKFRKLVLQKNYSSLKSALLGTLFGRSGNGNEKWVEALNDVSLKIESGHTVALIGRNGSGKSTFLKLLAGIYHPDSGKVTANGRVSALIELGAGFHPEFSGRENIYINGSLLGLSNAEIKKKFDEIVQFSELEEFIDSPVRTYSSGMYMRLGFSIAVNVDPDILLVDEVLAVGDEAFVRRCKEKIDDFKNAGKTIVMVTHDMAAVERFCDQAYLLEKGKFVDHGEPKRIIDMYRDLISDREEVNLEASVKAKQQDRTKDRWGSGEVEVKSIRCFDKDGKENYVFHNGEDIKIEFEYVAHVETSMPVFGVGIYNSEGTHCWGSNTHLDNIQVKIKSIKGPGKIAVHFRSPNLNAGTYYLEAAVHREDDYSYDYISWRAKFATFRIQEERKLPEYGVMTLKRDWEIDNESVESEFGK